MSGNKEKGDKGADVGEPPTATRGDGSKGKDDDSDRRVADLLAANGKEVTFCNLGEKQTLELGKEKVLVSGVPDLGSGPWTEVVRRGQRDGLQQIGAKSGNHVAGRVGVVMRSQIKSKDRPVVSRGAPATRIGKAMLPVRVQQQPHQSIAATTTPLPWRSFDKGDEGENGGCKIGKFQPVSAMGFPAADIQVKDVEEVAEFWESTLVIYVIGGTPSYTQFRRYVDMVWAPKGNTVVITKANGFIFCKFSVREELERIVSGGPWLFNGRFMIIKEWTEDIELENYLLSTMPVWIRLPNLPSVLWQVNSLGRIASLVGSPIRIDSNTEQRRRLDYARILVEISVEGDAPKEVHIRMPSGKVYRQPVIYEFLPDKCKTCMALGHNSFSCPNRGNAFWRPVNQTNRVSQEEKERTSVNPETDVMEVIVEDNAGEHWVNENAEQTSKEEQDQMVEQRDDEEMQMKIVDKGRVDADRVPKRKHPENNKLENVHNQEDRDNQMEVTKTQEEGLHSRPQGDNAKHQVQAQPEEVMQNQEHHIAEVRSVSLPSEGVVSDLPMREGHPFPHPPEHSNQATTGDSQGQAAPQSTGLREDIQNISQNRGEDTLITCEEGTVNTKLTILNPEWKAYMEQLQQDKLKSAEPRTQKHSDTRAIRGAQRKGRKTHPYST